MTSFDRPDQKDIPPSPWVIRHAPLIKAGGTVLDVACGDGRHIRWLSEHGFTVTGVDIDIAAAQPLQQETGAELIQADLETGIWPLESRQFDGVIVTNYLHRPHFPHLITALSDGGVLIFDTFAAGNERVGRPRNPDFLLQPGELLDAFSQKLQIVAYESGLESTPRPAVRQRVCAVNSAAPVRLSSRFSQPS